MCRILDRKTLWQPLLNPAKKNSLKPPIHPTNYLHPLVKVRENLQTLTNPLGTAWDKPLNMTDTKELATLARICLRSPKPHKKQKTSGLQINKATQNPKLPKNIQKLTITKNINRRVLKKQKIKIKTATVNKQKKNKQTHFAKAESLTALPPVITGSPEQSHPHTSQRRRCERTPRAWVLEAGCPYGVG